MQRLAIGCPGPHQYGCPNLVDVPGHQLTGPPLARYCMGLTSLSNVAYLQCTGAGTSGKLAVNIHARYSTPFAGIALLYIKGIQTAIRGTRPRVRSARMVLLDRHSSLNMCRKNFEPEFKWLSKQEKT